MRLPLCCAFSVFAFSALLCGQGGEGSKERIQKEIDTMRRQMQEGTLVRLNVRVTVRLRNENRITGVVKNGRFVERPDGLEFVQADRNTPGAGIRVWYYDGTTSCIFLPYEEIATYSIGQRLTETQVKAIEEKLELERKRADEAREAARKAREEEQKRQAEKAQKEQGEKGEKSEKPDDEKTGKGDGSQGGADAKTSDQKIEEQTKRLLALVDEFPPSKGWSADKAAEIEKRKITVHVFPNAEEKRFLEVLEDWKRGMALKKALEVAPPK